MMDWLVLLCALTVLLTVNTADCYGGSARLLTVRFQFTNDNF